MRFYQGVNAATGELLAGSFPICELDALDEILGRAKGAFEDYQTIEFSKKGLFLRQIRINLLEIETDLIDRAHLETGLSKPRIKTEFDRTTNQLLLFAGIIERGDWLEISIDTEDNERLPTPKPDLRKWYIPLGPVVVFGASNFPLAYSAIGGDSVSALAAGCSVIVKAHPSHPGTSELVAEMVIKAGKMTGMPDAIFQHVHAQGFELGAGLVEHPLTKAVGFTGSFSGGMALQKLANSRPVPIPVFAEMGSTNPVLLLPNALKNKAAFWAKTLVASLTASAGQFCTNPGIMIGLKSDALDVFVDKFKETLSLEPEQVMLSSSILQNFEAGRETLAKLEEVEFVYCKTPEAHRHVSPSLARVNGVDFIQNPLLHHEIFGPISLLVECADTDEMLKVINSLEGQLTGTVIGDAMDLERFDVHYKTLITKVGRMIFNGVPTGVEVVGSMHHGGPFPATTNSYFTAVGTDAIRRFLRPVVYQNCPNDLLPLALQNKNGLGIYRRINGELSKSDVV
jgi:NADP-dependent aldehyde dehydrogenase